MSQEITTEGILNKFEELISSRMTRFNYLLENSRFEFKQYQYDGVEWCVRNELKPNPVENIRGGFIVDEMGLGKTITMIGTMFVNFLPRTLIVVPPPLIQQWFNEIYNASGHQSLLYYGNNKKDITLLDINNASIVLTTYNTLLSHNCLVKKLVWNRVIFDEAHHLRNSKTERFNACKEIKARVHWLVTGTPIQNKQNDFYSLCSAAGMKSSFYNNPANLRTIGKNFVLRRTKAQIGILLPSVHKISKIVEWKSKKEMMLSEEIHSLIPNQTFVSTSKRKQLASIFGSSCPIMCMLRARQSCILPRLMTKMLEKMSTMGLITQDYSEALDTSSKIDAVVELIMERKDNGKGKIVFCSYRDEIDTIVQKLNSRGLKKIIQYDGRNSGGSNLVSIAEPADVLVIQLQTGCEGLNLQKNFAEIYFVSPHWNPCIEDQAVARCHRIGQTKPVDVFKFEMRGFCKDKNEEVDPITMENYINNVQENKREIIKKILDKQILDEK